MQVSKLTVMIVALASVVGTRYLAMGTGDTELYIFAGMRAAVTLEAGEGELAKWAFAKRLANAINQAMLVSMKPIPHRDHRTQRKPA